MKYYRLVFRGSDRDTNSTYSKPSFRCELPENLYKDGTNKKVGICLEKFSGYVETDAAVMDDVVVLRMQMGAVNGSQTDGAGRFAACDTLGVAVHQHTSAGENLVSTQHTHGDDGYLIYPSFMFSQGRIQFQLTRIDGVEVEQPTTVAFRDYIIVLGVKVYDEEEY